jgi:hypothetical protein
MPSVVAEIAFPAARCVGACAALLKIVETLQVALRAMHGLAGSAALDANFC